MKQLIIGMGDDTPRERHAIFLRSIERQRISADVQVFREDPLPWHPVVDRWKLIADYIRAGNYGHVIACDTFDVVFQANPFAWLEAHLGGHELVVVSEERKFKDCEGNKRGMMQSFPKLWEQMAERVICNAGIIAGNAQSVARISEDIYNWCQQDTRLPEFTPGFEDRLPDQQALNIVLPNYRVKISGAEAAWAFQYNHAHKFHDGEMYNAQGVKYAILHQYLYQWGDAVRQKYA